MKSENFNVNIKTLDDQAMYREICKKIQETDSIRYKLIWIVPLFSGIGMIVLWLEILNIPYFIVVIAGLFGTMITSFIYIWEKQNIQVYRAFIKHAAILESRKNEQERIHSTDSDMGPFSLINKLVKPKLFEKPELKIQLENQNTDDQQSINHSRNGINDGWGKVEAETAIYLSTIFLWLLMVIVGLIKIYFPTII
ncbi:MAG: hypothetical protein KAQ79_05050 [Cyclobacteriaceae bacterium]|nr:hypothetical protein [Cyclobacteriaceae bacterium]